MYEKYYLENYDLFKKLSNTVTDTLPYKHKPSRKESSYESMSMFEYFKGSEIIKKKIDIKYLNEELIGDFFDTPSFVSYNYLELSGPKALIDQFESNTKSTIIINSVRYISSEYKKLFDPSNLDFDKYKKKEQPITQQYCNWYEYFETSNYKWDDVNIIIMTRSDLYSAYRELYPHYLICTHTCEHYTTVGLTRHSGLSLGYHYNLNRLCVVDDNVIDIVDHNNEQTDTKEFMNFLFRTRILDFSTGYISLSKCKLFEYIETIYSTYRVMHTDRTIKYVEVNKHKTIHQQYPLINPHRQKLYLFNLQKLRQKKLTYRIDLPLAEDINFTKDLYMADMSVIILSYQFIEPFTNRRPMVCLSNYLFDSNKLYRCLSKKQKECFISSGLINSFSDIFIWKGRIIYFDKYNIYAGSSVYGPYRILSKSDYKMLAEKYPDEINKFIEIFNLKGCTIYCKKPNPNNIELINNEINNRLTNAVNYVSNCNITSQTKNELHKVFHSLDMTEIKENTLNVGIGMNKYALHFELIDDTNHTIFKEMLNKQIIDDEIDDYLSSCFENYSKDPGYYHKILTVYSIYSKFLYLQKNINYENVTFLIKGLLIFGNNINIQYSDYKISFQKLLNSFYRKNIEDLKKEFFIIVNKIISS